MLISRRIVGVLLAAAAVGGLAYAAPVQAAPAYPHMHLEATLHGSSAYRSVHGHAGYMSYWHREIDLSLWNARKLAGKTLIVYLHGTKVGTMTVRRGGSAHMYQHHGVPACSPGTTIRITTKPGKLIASGTLRHHHWMMSAPR